MKNIIAIAILTPLLLSFRFFDMGALKKFNCKTKEPPTTTMKNTIYYNYIKDKKKIEVVWDDDGVLGKSIVGTYNTYEKDGNLYWGKKGRPIWGGKQVKIYSLLTINTMKLKIKIYDNKGVLIQEIDELCKRGW